MLKLNACTRIWVCTETNIHNISSLFNEKPKTLLLLFIFFGGIIYPFFRKNSNNLLNEETQFTDWIFPTFCCFLMVFPYSQAPGALPASRSRRELPGGAGLNP